MLVATLRSAAMFRNRFILIPFTIVLILLVGRFVVAAFAATTAAAPAAAPTASPTATLLAAYPGPATPWPTALPASYPAAGRVHVVRQSDVLPSPTVAPTLTPVPTRVVPPIRSLSPGNHGRLSPTEHLSLTFNHEVDQASVEAAFSLTPTVAGSFEWQGLTLSFRPEGGLFAEQADYTLTLATGARTASGRPLLAAPYTLVFHTTALEDHLAWFGGRADVQVIPTDGRRAVQFVMSKDVASIVSFELYSLSDEQFLARYEQLVTEAEDYTLRRTIPLNGATLAARWPHGNRAAVRADPYGDTAWTSEAILPAEVSPGPYILNLNAGRLNDQLLVVISRNALTVRDAQGTLTAWLATREGGVAGAEVTVLGSGGERLAQGTTNAAGLAQFDALRNPLLIIARHGDDVSVAGFGEAWRTPVGYHGYGQPAHVGYVFTDRTVFAPGEGVNFKAFLRRDRDGVLDMLPEGAPVAVSLLRWEPEDWNWQTVSTQTVTTNAFGAVDGSLKLPAKAEPGGYSLQLSLGAETFTRNLEVRPAGASYHLRLEPQTRRAVAGEEVRVVVEVRDAAGQPAPDTSVRLSTHLIIPSYRRVLSNYGIANGWMGNGTAAVAKTDANGRATLEFTAALPEFYGGDGAEGWREELIGLEAEVGTVSAFSTLRVASSGERLTLDTAGGLHAAGAPVTVAARVVTLAGEPVASRTLAVEVFRYNPSEYGYTTLVRAASMKTDAEGNASTTFTAGAGRYQLRLTGYDAQWRLARVFHPLEIVGAAAPDNQLLIAADRAAYRVGDVAGLTIASPLGGPAWLTVERATVRRTQFITLTPPLTRVALPIEAGDAPNVFINVYAWAQPNDTLSDSLYTSLRERTLRTASLGLKIEQPEQALTVALTPGAEIYSTGAAATFTVRVTNARGEPVSAEVALALVGNSAAAWAEVDTASFFAAFHPWRSLTVGGFDSYAPRRDLFGDGGGCAGGCGGDWFDGQAAPSLAGLATAVWAPSLRTDWNGEATVTLPLPATFGDWRAIAIAATADAQVGQGEVVIEVR
jgi:hypothetical protein